MISTRATSRHSAPWPLAALPASPLHGVPARDARDWEAIGEWARGIARKLEPNQGSGAELVRGLQWHETHRTLDLLRSARAEGVEIHVRHSLYSGEFVRIVKKSG